MEVLKLTQPESKKGGGARGGGVMSLSRSMMISTGVLALVFVGGLLFCAYQFDRSRRLGSEFVRQSRWRIEAEQIAQLAGQLDLGPSQAENLARGRSRGRYERTGQRLSAGLMSLAGRPLDPAMLERVLEIKALHDERLEYNEKVFELADRGLEPESFAALMDDAAASLRGRISEQAAELSQSFSNEAERTAIVSEASLSRATKSTLAAALAGILLTLAIVAIQRRRLARATAPLIATIEAAISRRRGIRAPAAGDDEFGNLAERVNSMLERFDEHERSMESQSKHMLVACEQAERISREKGELLANLSENLRTPMNDIVGMTQILLECGLNAKQHACARNLETAFKSMLGVLDKVLDFAKLESNRLTLSTMDFDLRSLVHDVADRAGRLPAAEGLDTSIFIDENVPSLLCGDPGRLRQVIGNLLANALEHTSEGGEVHVRVELANENGASVRLKFSIEDTGVGLDQTAQSEMLGRDDPEGLGIGRIASVRGLGLTICQRLVEMMDGRMGIESAVGKGSTFYFTATFEMQRHETAYDTLPLGRTSEIKIFAVAANATRRRRMSRIFRKLGHVAVIHESCEEALAAAAAIDENGVNYSIVFVDDYESEGRMDAFFSAMCKTPLASIPFIFLTVTGRRGDAEYARSLGCAGYLSGKLSHDMIGRVITKVMRFWTEDQQSNSQDFITRHSLDEQRRRAARILLMEHDPVSREITSGALQRAGYHVESVESSREGIDLALKNSFHLILVDGDLPDDEGFQAGRVIRQRVTRPLRPVIVAMITDPSAEHRLRYIEGGFDEVLAKPIMAQQLIGTADQHILRPTAAGAVRSAATLVHGASAQAGAGETRGLADNLFKSIARGAAEGLIKNLEPGQTRDLLAETTEPGAEPTPILGLGQEPEGEWENEPSAENIEEGFAQVFTRKNSPVLVDWGVLVESSAGDQETEERMIREFLIDLATRFDAACRAVENDRIETLEAAARRLIDACERVGADPLARLCEQIHGCAGAGDMAAAKVLLEEAEPLQRKTRQFLSHRLTRVKNGPATEAEAS